MEEFLQDKIFQFYYHKIYGKKSNYQTFKTFADKDKVSFLINLYLFISNINKNNNDNSIKNKEKEINYNINNEKDNLYLDNYNKIMNEYTNILNKYNKEFHSKPNNIINEEKKEINNINTFQMNMVNEKCEKNETYKKDNNEFSINIDTDNYFEEKKEDDKEIIINSKRNDIDININHENKFKSGKENNKNDNINTDSIKNKNLTKEEYFQNRQQKDNEPIKDNNIKNEYNNTNTKNNNIENNLLEISSRSDEKINNSSMEKKSTSKFNINNDNNLKANISPKNQIKSTNSRNLTKKKLPEKKDIILEDQTITEKSLIHLEEFTNDNIVEKLIKCPQNKYISLNCSEANQIALVIINLMEAKNDLENEIEEERKKNIIKFDKLKLDYEKQKNDIKTSYDKKEINVIKVLGELEKEINDEKIFLEEEQKGYNLWDHISIENQRTKEIRENIMKKLENFKK